MLGGCTTSRPLMPTPNLYAMNDAYPADQVPERWRESQVDTLFVTDRAAQVDENGALAYGRERSDSLAYGIATVAIGSETSWPELVEASASTSRDRAFQVQVRSRVELGRFPATPHPFSVQADGTLVVDSKVREAFEQAANDFKSMVRERLALSSKKDVFIYVHGFANTFDESVGAVAEVWHFLGRTGVPIAYSWPAGYGGLFGYFVDRESGEFTVFHLKQFLRLIASIPEVSNIQILAHSRGTDVVTTALRELVIQSRASGRDPRLDLKIANLVMAAPDLDFGVVRQRLMAEKFGPAIGQITIYSRQADQALGASETLMGGTRFGRVQTSDLGAQEEIIFATVTNVNIIDVKGTGGAFGHGYFRDNPAVSSDLILLLRDEALPGSTSRPLTHKFLNFWELSKDYPRVAH